MYFDAKPCRVCGARVELRPREPGTTPAARDHDPDATVDERVCTDSSCASHADGGA
ncbi:MAG TPA: hypothetical protein VNS46_09255 [Nocardioides sp.]|nr:hypothetical protein [Nocardioides sp.]